MSETRRTALPPPLLVAAGLVGLEGLLLCAYALLELVNLHADRATMGLTTAAFFALVGIGLVAGAWMITHGNPRARSPIVVAQVISLGLAWSFRGGDTTVVAVVIAIVALIVLIGVLHPTSIDALSDESVPEEL